jgi:serine/threonine protein kinase
MRPIEARFGRYRLVRRLATGGMAEVHLATVDGAAGFRRQVVIKRVRAELSHERRFLRALVQEARLCALLQHPSIVQVLDFGERGGEYFLAMEYVEGVNLAYVLGRCRALGRPLSAGVVCYLGSELGAALAYAHDLRDSAGRPLNIVHRDVSPSNIMVTPQGGVKLLDFGIAKAALHDPGDLTSAGVIKGKLSYMSPEQAEGQLIDQRSDIFSLGVVLYECLTGQRLFRSVNKHEAVRRVRECRVAPPSSIRPELDPALDALVLKMLARDPGARFQHCQEVVAALKPLRHRLQGDSDGLREITSEIGSLSQEHVLAAHGGSWSAVEAPGTAAAAPPPRPRRFAPARIVVSLLAAAALAVLVALWPDRLPRELEPPAPAPARSERPLFVSTPIVAEEAPVPPAPARRPVAKRRVPKKVPRPAAPQVQSDPPELRNPFGTREVQ